MIKEKQMVISTVFKLGNRRVKVGYYKGDYIIEFRQLTDNLSPRAWHIVERDKIVTTGIKMSKDGAICVLQGLLDRLRADGAIKDLDPLNVQ